MLDFKIAEQQDNNTCLLLTSPRFYFILCFCLSSPGKRQYAMIYSSLPAPGLWKSLEFPISDLQMSWNLCPGHGLLYPSRDRGSPGPAINSVTHGRRRLYTFPRIFHSSRRKGIEEQPLPSWVHAYCAKWLRMSLGPELAAYQVQKNQSLQWSFLCSTIHIQSSSKWFSEKKKRQKHTPLGFQL